MGAQIYIISYELATKMANQIIQRGIKMIIADEAHFLKAHDSIRSRTLVPLLTRMKRLILLSGTPMLARPKELYNLLKMLRPDVFNDFFEYAHRYCNPKESQYTGGNG
jgi:SWI/SNF-related matrix-associated actin-dependent regulator of chromatin subfamily A-like protein 1